MSSPASTMRLTPCRSANSRRRSAECGREPAEVDVVHEDEPATAFDTAQFEQLIDHLDEVAGLHLDLADPVAHLRRDRLARGCGVAAERLGEKAHGRQGRPQLMGQVVDELGTDLLEAAKLGYVLEDDPDAAIERPTSAGHDGERGPGQVHLVAART